MARLPVRSVSILLLLASTTACTQAAVGVDMRGMNQYGRTSDNNSSYTGDSSRTMPLNSNYNPYQPAPVYSNSPPKFASQETYSDVYVPPVQHSDLPTIRSSNLAPVPFGTGTPAPAATTTTTATSSSATPPFYTPAAKPVTQSPAAAAPASGGSERINNPWKRPGDDQSANVPAEPAHQIFSDEVSTPIKEEVVAKAAELEPASGKASFMWPVGSKKVISGFGPKSGGAENDGINIAMAEGEPIWASADGEIAYVGNETKGYGTMVIIKHAGSKTTTYAHMSRATVDKYDRVKQGDIIGYVGATGDVKSPQLHFAIRDGKDPVDPAKYLPRSSS